MKVEENDCFEYFMSQAFHILKLPLSPKSYGKPQSIQVHQSMINKRKTTFPKFINGGGTHEEDVHENTSIYIDKAK